VSAAALLDAALTHVESQSIRSWAEGQREAWLGIASRWLAKHGARYSDSDAVTRFATYIMCEAIGL
jgi:hypothetical protein